MSEAGEPNPSQRIDKWLWYARFLKSRSLATGLAESGRIRITRPGASPDRVTRASVAVRPGDVLTFPLGHRVQVVRVVATGTRRGPAPEARLLYEDLTPCLVPAQTPEDRLVASGPAVPSRESGAGRPTKQERRALDRLRRSE